MINSFNTTVATKFNVNIAIFIQYLAQRTFTNLANNKHLYDGLCWIYIPINSFKDIFPYFTHQKMRAIVNNSSELYLIDRGNYNAALYNIDEWFSWFALTPPTYKFYPELCKKTYILALNKTINNDSPYAHSTRHSWRTTFNEILGKECVL